MPRNRCSATPGMGDRLAPESPFGFPPEWVFGLGRNTQRAGPRLRPRPLRLLRHGAPRRLLLQGARPLPFLRRAPRPRVGLAPRRGRLLPRVPYRQWTVSFPFELRWRLMKEQGLLEAALRHLTRLVFAWLRASARRVGARGRLLTGAVTHVQYFGSALQLSPHFHAIIPDGVFVETDGAVGFLQVPPPTPEDVASLVQRLARRLAKLLRQRGLDDAQPDAGGRPRRPPPRVAPASPSPSAPPASRRPALSTAASPSPTASPSTPTPLPTPTTGRASSACAGTAPAGRSPPPASPAARTASSNTR